MTIENHNDILGDTDVQCKGKGAAMVEWERQRIDSDLSADMQWALDQLPEAYRWAVLLADVEEFTYQEIAATMECPVGTVMSRISRGRRMLGRLLNERRSADRPAIRIVARER